MSIPDLFGPSNQAGRPFGPVPVQVVLGLILVLTASASFGLGILVGRDMPAAGKGGEAADGVWIENRAADLPAAAGAAPAASAVRTVPTVVAPAVESAPAVTVEPLVGKYVGSKTGTKYYLPTCSGAKRIKDENKRWFVSKEDAEKDGYTAAASCPGL